MGQIPKDPQQLAQDILAGRISIQQLQAEQARRRAAQETLRQNMRAQAAPRSVKPRPQSSRQIVAPSTSFTRTSVQPDDSSPRSAPTKKRPPSKNRPAGSDAGGTTANPASTAPAVKPTTRAPNQSGATPRTAAQTVRAVMNNPNTLRSVFVLSELLDKPLSLRRDPLERF